MNVQPLHPSSPHPTYPSPLGEFKIYSYETATRKNSFDVVIHTEMSPDHLIEFLSAHSIYVSPDAVSRVDQGYHLFFSDQAHHENPLYGQFFAHLFGGELAPSGRGLEELTVFPSRPLNFQIFGHLAVNHSKLSGVRPTSDWAVTW